MNNYNNNSNNKKIYISMFLLLLLLLLLVGNFYFMFFFWFNQLCNKKDRRKDCLFRFFWNGSIHIETRFITIMMMMMKRIWSLVYCLPMFFSFIFFILYFSFFRYCCSDLWWLWVFGDGFHDDVHDDNHSFYFYGHQNHHHHHYWSTAAIIISCVAS